MGVRDIQGPGTTKISHSYVFFHLHRPYENRLDRQESIPCEGGLWIWRRRSERAGCVFALHLRVQSRRFRTSSAVASTMVEHVQSKPDEPRMPPSDKGEGWRFTCGPPLQGVWEQGIKGWFQSKCGSTMPAFAKTLVSHEVMWIRLFLRGEGRRFKSCTVHSPTISNASCSGGGIPDGDPR